MTMDFLKGVTKDLEKAGLAVGASEPPRYWFSTGNHVLNKIISGSFHKGIPQGRLLCYTGPSGSGKSFLAANAMREAQKAGAHVVMIDSENAMDDDFAQALGVDTENNYTYIPVITIPEVKKVVSAFLKGYKAEYGDDPNAPRILFVIDSLDMLLTETESAQWDKGETKGDQGQRNKQLKAMLRSFVQAVKRPNVSMVITAQVYENQDVMNGEGRWIVSGAVKFSLSQIIMLTKLKLKKSGEREVLGIRMKCEGYKTRFTKPYQTVTVEVPYETGMDPYNGLPEVGKEMGVVDQKGSWYYFGEEKWKGKVMPTEHAEALLKACEEKREKFLEADIADDELLGPDSRDSVKTRRKKNAGAETE